MDRPATSTPVSPHDVTALLAALVMDVAECEVGGLSADGVVELLAAVRDSQGALDGLVVRLGLRADELAAVGEGATRLRCWSVACVARPLVEKHAGFGPHRSGRKLVTHSVVGRLRVIMSIP